MDVKRLLEILRGRRRSIFLSLVSGCVLITMYSMEWSFSVHMNGFISFVSRKGFGVIRPNANTSDANTSDATTSEANISKMTPTRSEANISRMKPTRLKESIFTWNALTSLSHREREFRMMWHNIITKFENKVLDTCTDSPEARKFCPIKLPGGKCKKTDLTDTEFKKYLSGVPHEELLSNNTFLYPFEEVLVNTPALDNPKSLPSLTLSKLVPLAIVSKGSVLTCSVGELVKIRADLVDGFGKRRRIGYDDVRAWITGMATPGFVANAAEVVDLRNGSYEISVRCLWPGTKSQIHVAVSYPREYLRRVLIDRRLGVYRLTDGVFKNGKISQSTPCWSTPNVPWPCICNYTEPNNASFYCGRPLDSRLSCSDLHGIDYGNEIPRFYRFPGSTQAEMEMYLTMPGSARKSLIRQNLYIEVDRKRSNKDQQVPCTMSSPKVTWSTPGPKGYFDKSRIWHPFHCKGRTLNQKDLRQCLSNTNIIIFGDSNAREMYQTLLSLLGRQPNKMNISVTLRVHEYHMFTVVNGVVFKYGSVPFQIDAIPATGRYIVIVHYFAHVTHAHFSVLHDRLLLLKPAILRALARNPNVVFALRGPHVMSYHGYFLHSVGGDTQGLYLQKLIIELFEDIQDKVFFLDGWGMTTATENRFIHPSRIIPTAMFKHLFSFLC